MMRYYRNVGVGFRTARIELNRVDGFEIDEIKLSVRLVVAHVSFVRLFL